MQKFMISEADFTNRTLSPDLIYQCVKVLRYKINDEFIVGLNNKNYLVVIRNITDKTLIYEIKEELNIDTELDVFVTIIQGYPKGDKFEDIIKHGTQLGAAAFVPCLMKRSQFKIDEKRMNNKIERFKKIAREASEQSFRNQIPDVLPFITLNKIDLYSFDLIFVCYEEEAKHNNIKGLKETIRCLPKGAKIAFIIGPEGGIDESEINYLKQFNNIKFISLGKRILRTEIASLYALSTISYERELE